MVLIKFVAAIDLDQSEIDSHGDFDASSVQPSILSMTNSLERFKLWQILLRVWLPQKTNYYMNLFFVHHVALRGPNTPPIITILLRSQSATIYSPRNVLRIALTNLYNDFIVIILALFCADLQNYSMGTQLGQKLDSGPNLNLEK